MTCVSPNRKFLYMKFSNFAVFCREYFQSESVWTKSRSAISPDNPYIANHNVRIEKLEGISKDLQDRIKKINEQLAILGDGGLDINAIKGLMDKFKKE